LPSTPDPRCRRRRPRGTSSALPSPSIPGKERHAAGASVVLLGRLTGEVTPPTTSLLGSRMTAAGFAVMLLAVSAGVGPGEYAVLLGLVGVLVGANLIVLGVRRTADEEPTTPVGVAAFAGVGALAASFLRRNLVGAGLILSSSAVTAVAGEASPELRCSMFALLLLGMSLITIGIRGE
ncbi:hypothetical protein EJB05_09506, partial [Eragrostis curvula]